VKSLKAGQMGCTAAVIGAGGWWLVAGGWWLVAGGWWLVAGGRLDYLPVL
jgi:hypothetical protein